MKHDNVKQNSILEFAALGFKTIMEEPEGNRVVAMELPVESGVHGFIVLLQPALPCIN